MRLTDDHCQHPANVARRVGFEPTMFLLLVLETSPFDHSGTDEYIFEALEGLEPSTSRFTDGRSPWNNANFCTPSRNRTHYMNGFGDRIATLAVRRIYYFILCRRQGSNLQCLPTPVLQTGDLPLSRLRQILFNMSMNFCGEREI